MESLRRKTYAYYGTRSYDSMTVCYGLDTELRLPKAQSIGLESYDWSVHAAIASLCTEAIISHSLKPITSSALPLSIRAGRSRRWLSLNCWHLIYERDDVNENDDNLGENGVSRVMPNFFDLV